MNPAEMTTYKRADGELISDYGWVGDLDYFDDDYCDPVELVEEVWERKSVRTFWHLPSRLYSCGVADCDEDSVAWQQNELGDWQEVCDQHRMVDQ